MTDFELLLVPAFDSMIFSKIRQIESRLARSMRNNTIRVAPAATELEIAQNKMF